MIQDRTLDWRPKPDPRNALFLMSGMNCFSNGLTRKNIMRKKSVWLNQFNEGACTGFSAEHVRALSPYPQQVSNESAREIYRRARFLDEWPGEDYEGSSVNGAMKAEREVGNIKEWRWCWSLKEVDHALSYHGAVAAGTWWWTGMWEPDSEGLLHTTGYKEGGHAYAIGGKRTLAGGLRQYWIDNSWGPEWGVDGGAWISEFDLEQLLNDDGEFACPLKVRR